MEAHRVIINTDGVTDEQKRSAKFQSAYADMLAQLTAPGFAHVLCCHEAAHLVYFTIAGMQNYDPQPARLEYDPQLDDYVGSLAGIQLLDLPQWTPGKFGEWFYNVARAHAAGGVVAREMMSSTGGTWKDDTGGDQDDKERFIKVCDQLNTDPNVTIDAEDAWKKAQESILQDLEDPDWLSIIEKQAEDLRPLLGL
jgi:hypothetical protein